MQPALPAVANPCYAPCASQMYLPLYVDLASRNNFTLIINCNGAVCSPCAPLLPGAYFASSLLQAAGYSSKRVECVVSKMKEFGVIFKPAEPILQEGEGPCGS